MMVHYKKVALIILIAQAMATGIDMYACITTFVNDKSGKILIYNRNDETIIPISKSQRRRFGNQHEHVQFVIYRQQQLEKGSTKERLFVPVYTCEQARCAKNGNVQLKLSDIENNRDSARFFTITEHAPYVSMTKQVANSQLR